MATAIALATSGLLAVTGAAPAGAETTAGCGKTPSLTSGTRTITSSGQNRSYILRIPDGYDSSRPYKLIFGLHWLNGSATNVDNDQFYGVRPLANNSAIFVAPQGLNAGWANTNGQDVTLMDDIRTQIENALCVDTTQRFAMGFSYGGAMSYALACARPTIFRAVGVFSGAQLSGCSGGTQPVAYLGIHGTNDSVLNISQGRSLRDKFVGLNGCTAQSPREPSSGQSQIKTQYTGCRAGYPVTWIAFSGDHYTPSFVGSEAWSFFSALGSTTTSTSGTTSTTTRTTTTTSTGTTPGSGAGQLVTPAGKCLDVSGTGNGSSARINTCGDSSGQVWEFASDGTLRTLGGSMCLDASNRGTANGTALIIYACHGEANQRFSLGSNSSIVGEGSGRCVDVPNGSSTDGTNVQLYDCWGGDPQKWTLRSSGNPTTTTTTTSNPPTTTTTTSNPRTTTTTTTTTTTSGGGSCSATYTTNNSWTGGFQGTVEVRATGGWTVTLTMPGGTSISSLWNGRASGTSGTVTVSDVGWNANGGSFGFVANGSGTPTVSCS